jgi:hypothetical protein
MTEQGHLSPCFADTNSGQEIQPDVSILGLRAIIENGSNLCCDPAHREAETTC